MLPAAVFYDQILSHNSESVCNFLFCCTAGFIGGFVLFFYGAVLRARRRLIENIPTSKVRSMAVGLVELKGTACEYKGFLESPFSGARCVHYQYHVEELTSSGKSSHWDTVAKYVSPEFFYLRDDTGKVLVNPAGADLRLEVDCKYSTQMFANGNKETFFAGLDRLSIVHSSFGFSKTMRGKEIYVEPGDDIYVLGSAVPAPEADVGRDSDESALWLAKGQGPYFCISDRSENELVSSMWLRMALCLYGGPVLTVVTSCILLRFILLHPK